MFLKDILSTKESEVISIQPTATIKEAAELMNSNKIGALMVLKDNGEIAGILTERDILRKLDHIKPELSVKEIMTPAQKLIIAHQEDSVEFAMQVFTANRIRHLPVLDGSRLCGIISIGDAVKSQLSSLQTENKLLMDYISGEEFIIPRQ